MSSLRGPFKVGVKPGFVQGSRCGLLVLFAPACAKSSLVRRPCAFLMGWLAQKLRSTWLMLEGHIFPCAALVFRAMAAMIAIFVCTL